MEDLEFGIASGCESVGSAVLAALALPAFKLSDQMAGETVSAWKTRRKLDRMWAQNLRASAGRAKVEYVRDELAAQSSGILMRGLKSGIITAREITAAERIYRLGQMSRICGGAVTAFYGERIGSGEVDYEHGVAAELAFRAVMDAMPTKQCREFVRRVIVEGEGMEVSIGQIIPHGLSTQSRKLGGAWVFLQIVLSTAVEHFDAVGWQ